ncbi:MAG: M28 family peptidase [Ferruginibacter sp.]|nr:M28 family peptidase [Ferruginibacter sp.]
MRLLFLFFLCTIGLSVTAQDKSAHYAQNINTDFLQKHLTIIAGAEMEGRGTGTPGERKAAEYIQNFFKNTGLTTVPGAEGYRQYFPLIKDSMTFSSLSFSKRNAVVGKDFVIPAIANNNGEFSSKSWIFIGYGIEDEKYNDYKDIDVKGKTVIFFLGEPKEKENYIINNTNRPSTWTFPGLRKKLALAAQKGAAGALVISPTIENFSDKYIQSAKVTDLSFPHTNKDEAVNYALITTGFAEQLFGSNSLIAKARKSEPFTNNDRVEKKIKTTFKYTEEQTIVNSSNVIGMVEGSDKKEEYIFVTAHYDHLGIRNGKIYYGADDDGSGTVAVMNIAQSFAKAKAEGSGPRRSVVFMTVSGEERGLWGSEYYSENPLLPLEKTSVDLNIDMIGRNDTERQDTLTDYVYVVGHDKISTDLPVINEEVNNRYTKLVLDYKFDDPKDPNRIYFRSDHYNFARKGVPVLFFYDGMLQSDYHKPTDTVDKINWPVYEKRAQMIFHTAWEMANREDLLKRDKPIPTDTRY